MLYYLKIYRALFSINISNLLIYRANFINSLLSSLAWGIFSLLSILLLTSKTSQVFTWTREEIILLTACYSIVIGVFHTLFSRNFDKLSEVVHRGIFDMILTKPADAQFLVTTRYINYTSLSRIIIGIIAVFFISSNSHVNITFVTLITSIFYMAVGIIILYNIWVLVMSITIWFTRLNNLPEFMYSVSNMSRYPPEIFKNVLGYAFIFLLPISLIIVTPVKAWFGKLTFYDFLMPLIVCFVLTYISRKFWLFALKFYTSAGG